MEKKGHQLYEVEHWHIESCDALICAFDRVKCINKTCIYLLLVCTIALKEEWDSAGQSHNSLLYYCTLHWQQEWAVCICVQVSLHVCVLWGALLAVEDNGFGQLSHKDMTSSGWKKKKKAQSCLIPSLLCFILFSSSHSLSSLYHFFFKWMRRNTHHDWNDNRTKLNLDKFW